MADKRIIEQTATSEVFVDDWLVKDSSTEGTTKIRPSNLKDYIAAGLVPETMVADEYVTTSTYDSGDICIYEGVLYKALEDDITGDWDSTKWDAITISSELANTGTGDVADVYENGVSVVDPTDKIARIHGHKEVTQAQYDALPSSKLTDGILYCIKDSEFSAENVPYDNTSSQGVQATNVQDALDEAFQRTMDMSTWFTDIVAENFDYTKNYTVGDYVFHFPSIGVIKLYRCIENTSGVWDSTKWEEVKVTDELQELDENKADTDGFYDELFAGNLVTDMHTADNKPYTYRQSPSGKSAVDLSVVGGTVAWNQQLSLSNLPSDSALYSNTTYTVNGVTFTKNNDGSITIQTESGGATSETSVKIGNDARLGFIQNHIHYISRCKGGSASTYYFNYAGGRYVYDNDKIFAKQPSGFNMWLTVKQGTVITTPVKVYPQVVDLEQMFGTTIADAVYTMEEATAGSGIAWLKSYGFLTKDYYPYNSGSLQSVKTSGRKIVGFNQFDEEWELLPGGSWRQSVNYIPVLGGMTYYCHTPNFTSTAVLYANFYDADKNVISELNNIGQNTTFNIPNGVSYIKIRLWYTIDSSDICINISDTAKNGTYSPYKIKSYPLDSNLTLRGIVKKDANNNLYYDGDIYKSDGSVKRKYGIVDLGSLSWSYDTTYSRMVATNDDIKAANVRTLDFACVKYQAITDGRSISNIPDKSIYNGAESNHSKIFIHDSAYNDVQTFKTAMSGVYLVFEKQTPTTESSTPFTNPQLVGSTEEFIDTRDVPIPVGGERKYYTDLKAKLEELAKIPDVPTTNGTYTLKATRSASGVVYNWVSG